MENLFDSLDSLLDLPFPAFQKKLIKLEEEFKNIDIAELSDEELEGYFTRIKNEYETHTNDGTKTRLEILGYLSHFDILIEKFFPDYVAIFQAGMEREDQNIIARVNYGFLEHMDEILREYTHRLSDPDNYPSYTGFIQELIQNSMIDLFFWLQDRETEQEKSVETSDKNSDIFIQLSAGTKNTPLKYTRECLELLGSGVLEKIFYDHGYPMRMSPIDPELQLIGRYERKKG